MAMGIHFNYKTDNRRGWMLCAGMITVELFLIAGSFIVYEYYETDFSILRLSEFIGFELLQVFVLNQPIILCTSLLHSLQKRYIVLNSLLRYTMFHLQK